MKIRGNRAHLPVSQKIVVYKVIFSRKQKKKMFFTCHKQVCVSNFSYQQFLVWFRDGKNRKQSSSSSLVNLYQGYFFLKKKKQRYGQGERVFEISDLCCFTSGQGVRYKLKHEIGNQGDMEKIHVKQQFFEARGPQGQFF